MIPSTHHGKWSGEKRLWMEPGTPVARSQGTITASETKLEYTWSYRNEPQRGTLELFGPGAAVRAAWKDTFHAANGFNFHGFAEDGLVRLFGTYPAGDGPEWGWRIEIDSRDPEHVTLRMFNVIPGGPVMPAVDFRAAR